MEDPENPNQYREMPILGDIHEILKKNTETKRLANILNRLVHGSASTFNQQTNVSLERHGKDVLQEQRLLTQQKIF